MNIPEGAKHIIDTLVSHGFEAYIVGGCVRDMLLDREPEDWDITTSAKPEEVKSLFRRTIDTGIEHGTVTVMIKDEGFEVTTYRMDGVYEDHRHPKEVTFTPNLEEDLKRRDFTINAMAYNDKAGVIDLFDGRKDLKNGIIRCVGDPMERFDEDALRMLRGIRFAGQLQFTIDDDTLAAIERLSDTLVNVSAERIRVELTKLLISDGADRLRLAYETGLSKYFLPELDDMINTQQNNPHHCYSVGEHSMHVVEYINAAVKEKNTPNGIIDKRSHVALVFAGLLHDVAKPKCKTTDEKGVDHFHGHDALGEKMSGEILRRLRFDNDTISLVKCLVRNHDLRYHDCKNRGMRRIAGRLGKDRMPFLFLLQRADTLAQSEYKRQEKLAVLDAGMSLYDEICEANDAVTVAELKISGRDLIDEKGYESGPAIGAELNRLLEMVMDDPSLNTKERLLDAVR